MGEAGLTIGKSDTASLAPLLEPSLIGWDELDDGYHGLLELVRSLLGVVPDCDRYLEVWPPAFRSYNVMVPNLLNLPVPVLGMSGPPPSVIGLAMYVASRTAACGYCSAHSCSFALRRGADPAKVAAALLPDRTHFEPGELAAVTVARSLASDPGELRARDKTALIEAYGEDGAEWIALSVVMMGFLNKFMSTVGLEIEQPVLDDVQIVESDGSHPAPPVDGLRSRLRILPLLPAAIRYDRRAQRGMPRSSAAVSRALSETVGHDFPVLAGLRSARARRAIATMLRYNLDPAPSIIGIRTKVVAGAVYAAAVGDAHLAADVEALANHLALPVELLTAAAAYGRDEVPAPEAEAALALVREASLSPVTLSTATVRDCAQDLAPSAIIELVTWLSVLQLLHRLTRYVTPVT